jgi:hypothetical protein
MTRNIYEENNKKQIDIELLILNRQPNSITTGQWLYHSLLFVNATKGKHQRENESKVTTHVEHSETNAYHLTVSKYTHACAK